VTIRSLGLLNLHPAEQHAVQGVATRDEQRVVAYPGIFVLDERGVIREQGYRIRSIALLFPTRVLNVGAGFVASRQLVAVESVLSV
jgi:hypothetical protein